MPFQSPKRKRSEETFVPKLQPVLNDLSTTDTAGMSPRTSGMTGRFRDLQIHHHSMLHNSEDSTPAPPNRVIRFTETHTPEPTTPPTDAPEPNLPTLQTSSTTTTMPRPLTSPNPPSPPSPSKKRRRSSPSPNPSPAHSPPSLFPQSLTKEGGTKEGGTESSGFWSDAEITGHNPDPADPDDDLTGINGIGFKPTPAIAYARSQRRKQQVAEWRRREAAEAREKRGRERGRDRGRVNGRAGDGVGDGQRGDVGAGVGEEGRKVRFEDG